MLTLLIFAVGRGNDIFNFVEDLFEKTDRQFSDINFNIPAIIATVLGTSVVAEVIFGQTCPSLPLYNNTNAAPRWDNDNTGRFFLDWTKLCDTNGNNQAPRNCPQLPAITYSVWTDFCILKLIFTSNAASRFFFQNI